MPTTYPTAATVTRVDAKVAERTLRLAWETTDPPSVGSQVYLDGRLAYSGVARRCVLPFYAIAGSSVWVDVIAVTADAAEANTDYAGAGVLPSELSGAGAARASLSWYGGPGPPGVPLRFDVFRGGAPGEPVDYSGAVASVPAGPGPNRRWGYGAGPYGAGGYGAGVGLYTYVSDPLGGGVWGFGVVTVYADLSRSPPAESTVAVSAAPAHPATPHPLSPSVSYSYDPATGMLDLFWNASPG